MSGRCSLHERDEEFIYNFTLRNRRVENFWKSYAWMGGRYY